MKTFKLIAIISLATFIFGCASAPPQFPVEFSGTESLKDATISVSMTEVKAPSMIYPGADCLLCLGVAATANSALSSHTKTLPTDDLASLGQDLLDLLSEKGLSAKLSESPFSFKGLKKSTEASYNSARKDFTALKDQYDTSHLLVIDIPRIGITRNYSAYIPTSVPYVSITGTAFLVNLETNTLDWYLPLGETLYTDGEWKEPSDFPNLTNTYYEAIEKIRDQALTVIKDL